MLTAVEKKKMIFWIKMGKIYDLKFFGYRISWNIGGIYKKKKKNNKPPHRRFIYPIAVSTSNDRYWLAKVTIGSEIRDTLHHSILSFNLYNNKKKYLTNINFG